MRRVPSRVRHARKADPRPRHLPGRPPPHPWRSTLAGPRLSRATRQTAPRPESHCNRLPRPRPRRVLSRPSSRPPPLRHRPARRLQRQSVQEANRPQLPTHPTRPVRQRSRGRQKALPPPNPPGRQNDLHLLTPPPSLERNRQVNSDLKDQADGPERLCHPLPASICEGMESTPAISIPAARTADRPFSNARALWQLWSPLAFVFRIGEEPGTFSLKTEEKSGEVSRWEAALWRSLSFSEATCRPQPAECRG